MRPLRKFLFNPIIELAKHGKLSGLLMILATILSLVLSNSDSGAGYAGLWQTPIPIPGFHHSLLFWINDALMPLFFLLVGIEIRRELVKGELSSRSQAILPVFAALGGVIVPAVIYLLFNRNSQEYLHGWAIPTATDIAFSLGIISLLGNRVPFFLKVFLTALAIIDDLVAIIIIACFYSMDLQILMILSALAVMIFMNILKRKKVRLISPYLLSGCLLWYFIMRSGIHPAIAGVLLAFTIPVSLAQKLEERLFKIVYYAILPLFALANTAIPLSMNLTDAMTSTLSLGIIAGLFIGKPAGIFGVSFLFVKTGISRIPAGVSWKMIAGMGMIAGIGFTMSIFMASLSFNTGSLTNTAKLAIISGSVISALGGMLVLYFSTRRQVKHQ